MKNFLVEIPKGVKVNENLSANVKMKSLKKCGKVDIHILRDMKPLYKRKRNSKETAFENVDSSNTNNSERIAMSFRCVTNCTMCSVHAYKAVGIGITKKKL